MKNFKDILEASSSDAIPRMEELSGLLGPDFADKLDKADMKVKKQAAKIFQQAIALVKGLK